MEAEYKYEAMPDGEDRLLAIVEFLLKDDEREETQYVKPSPYRENR